MAQVQLTRREPNPVPYLVVPAYLTVTLCVWWLFALTHRVRSSRIVEWNIAAAALVTVAWTVGYCTWAWRHALWRELP